MKSITIEGGVYLDTLHNQYSGGQYKFFQGKFESWDQYIAVMPHTMTVELPADFDPRTAQVAALEKQREELHAKFALAVTEINARISKLLAITNEVGAGAPARPALPSVPCACATGASGS